MKRNIETEKNTKIANFYLSEEDNSLDAYEILSKKYNMSAVIRDLIKQKAYESNLIKDVYVRSYQELVDKFQQFYPYDVGLEYECSAELCIKFKLDWCDIVHNNKLEELEKLFENKSMRFRFYRRDKDKRIELVEVLE